MARKGPRCGRDARKNYFSTNWPRAVPTRWSASVLRVSAGMTASIWTCLRRFGQGHSRPGGTGEHGRRGRP